jgi:hypothetical protein
MRNRIRLALSLAIAVSLAGASFAAAQDKKAAEEKWTGTISDAMCGKTHGARGGTPEKDHDCAVRCAAKGGYVFVSNDKIFKLADASQKMKDVETHAGHRVEITGTMKGDTITITKVTMLK